MDETNVLFAVVDSLRADAVFGPDSFETPTLDALAEEGIAFETCISQGISTAPSMTAMLTGRYPLDYGGHWFLEEDQPTFAEEFRAAGYRTGAIHSNPYVSSTRNFDKGFDSFQQDVVSFEPDRYIEGLPDKLLRVASRVGRLLRKTPYTSVPVVNQRIRKWVDAEKGHPWFLWTQYMDVHGPYLPGGEASYYEKLRAEWLWRKAAVRNPQGVTDAQHEELRTNYRMEVEFFDDQFGVLLEHLDERGILEDTIVVVVGDHGDEFCEHGWYGHCNLPYDELTHVPLIVKPPAGAAGFEGQRVDDLVRCLDILPTVADYADVPFSKKMRERLVGESLLPVIRTGEPPTFDLALTEKKVWSASELRFGFRTEDWKFLYDGKTESEYLYNLTEDPAETVNVVHRNPEIAEEFRSFLADRVESIRKTGADVTIPDIKPTAGLEERLRALGYQ